MSSTLTRTIKKHPWALITKVFSLVPTSSPAFSRYSAFGVQWNSNSHVSFDTAQSGTRRLPARHMPVSNFFGSPSFITLPIVFEKGFFCSQ